MVITTGETASWVKESKEVRNNLSYAYRSTIPNIMQDIMQDPRVLINDHIVNQNFENDPQLAVGIHTEMGQPLLVIGMLFIFPSYRGKGLGKTIIEHLKQYVADKGAIQVAVDADNLTNLGAYYEKLGFISTKTERKDDLGKLYVDYFWSKRKFILHDTPTGTLIQPQ